MSRALLVFVLLCGLGTARSARAELGDPTRPPDFANVTVETIESGGSSFSVSSILVAPERQVAIVNGTRVEVGDEVGGATVTQIKAQAVLLQLAEEEIELRISGVPVKATAKSYGGEGEE